MPVDQAVKRQDSLRAFKGYGDDERGPGDGARDGRKHELSVYIAGIRGKQLRVPLGGTGYLSGQPFYVFANEL